MSARWKLVLAVLLLVVVGGGLAAYKTLRLGVPFWQGERVSEWLVEARVSFVATGKPVKARLALPSEAVNKGAGQEAGSLAYHYNIEPDQGEYTAIWSSAGTRVDSQALYFRVRFPDGSGSGGEPKAPVAPPDEPLPPGLGGSVGEAACKAALRGRVRR